MTLTHWMCWCWVWGKKKNFQLSLKRRQRQSSIFESGRKFCVDGTRERTSCKGCQSEPLCMQLSVVSSTKTSSSWKLLRLAYRDQTSIVAPCRVDIRRRWRVRSASESCGHNLTDQASKNTESTSYCHRRDCVNCLSSFFTVA